MRKSTIPIIIILILATFAAIRCSRQTSISPTLTGADTAGTSAASAILWGVWEIMVDGDGNVKTVPLRGADFAANVVSLVDASPGNLVVQVVDVDIQPTYVDYHLDIGLKHPFPTMPKFTGFDVCGIVMGEGNTPHPYDPTLIYGGTGMLTLLSADGFTRWMNRPEFLGVSPVLLGYTPGKSGSPGFNPTATLNAYKYFCDGLTSEADAFDYLSANPSDRGFFTAGSTNMRRYDLRWFGLGPLTFQYAVLARWEPNINTPGDPVDIPGDFPAGSNAAESVAVSVDNDTSDMWYDGSAGGGSFRADISILNWNAELGTGGAMEEYEIGLYSSAWTGGAAPDMTPVMSGDNYFTFGADVAATPLASGPLDIWITIAHPGETYANPPGTPNGASDKTLAAYFSYEANVTFSGTGFWEPPTDHPPRFCFIHHSCGSGFLFDGGMWGMLEDAGFEVHDRTYGDGWVGDNTDPNNWPTTFTEYYDDMMTWEMDPGVQYDIIAFKSCYPACAISSDEMLEEYYGYYAIVKSVTETHPEALFIPWSPPPLNPTATNPEDAARARIFATWLAETYDTGEFNMASFDGYNVLAGSDPGSGDYNCLRSDYQIDSSNSHPNHEGNVAVAEAFTAWITDLVW